MRAHTAAEILDKAHRLMAECLQMRPEESAHGVNKEERQLENRSILTLGVRVFIGSAW